MYPEIEDLGQQLIKVAFSASTVAQTSGGYSVTKGSDSVAENKRRSLCVRIG
jgi:hypothetical protein